MSALLEPALHCALVAQLGGPADDFPSPLYVVNRLGRVVFCNEALAQLLGARAEELVGKPSLLLYPADVAPALLMERVHALIGDAAPAKLRTRMRRRDGGGTLPVELAVTNLQHQDEIAGFIVQVAPLPEANGRPSVEHLLSLTPEEADALPYGLIALDRSGVVIAYNDTEARLSGLARGGVLGRNFFLEVAPCTLVRGFAGLYRQMVDTGEPASAQFDFVFRFSRGDQPVSVRMAYFRQLGQGILVVEPRHRSA